MHFGEHMTIDGYGGDSSLLDSGDLVRECISKLCTLLEMHAMTDIVVISAPDNQIKDPGGWSGYVIIAESHISIHTFPKRRFISADVYTCRNGLDQQKVKEFFIDSFNLKEVEINFIIRGQKYPDHNIS